jgi:hypothetical protein
VGLLAQKCFPSGVDIAENYYRIEATIRSTKAAAAQKPPAIFEAAACSPDGAYSRIDIMQGCREKGAWNLIEVKSTTGVKGYHIDDMALQRYAFSRAGYGIRKSVLMHLDNGYVKKGPLDVRKLFQLEDCTADVRTRMAAVPENLVPIKAVLASRSEPDIPIGDQCRAPFDCDFIPYCWRHVPDYSVYNLFRGGKLADLLARGILEVADVPDDIDVTPRQAIEIEAFRLGRVHADRAALARFLDRLAYPLFFLDYETINPAVPLYDLTRPYQPVAFQFSLHVQPHRGGPVTHTGFLHTDAGDPRPAFLAALLESCGTSGSVVVYNRPFEAGVNAALAEAFTDDAAALGAINARMVDLLVPFRSRCLYHPDMKGSASLKRVLPALVPALSYQGLAIADGETASLAYLATLQDEVTDEHKKKIYADLEEYCRLDTLAEVKLLEALYRAAG